MAFLDVLDVTPAPPDYVRSPGAQAAITNALECLQAEEDERRRLEGPEARASRRWMRALRLSPTIDVMEALLAGEKVPLEKSG